MLSFTEALALMLTILKKAAFSEFFFFSLEKLNFEKKQNNFTISLKTWWAQYTKSCKVGLLGKV